jgi:2-polyprenyl-3-methyl-5-hydroxy-6-metoxy-1,4-benzoquinol methylase
MSKWSKIYRDQLSAAGSLDSFIKEKVGYKRKLIGIVRRYCKKHKTILEAGCGSGITSIYLDSLGYKVTGIDSDPDMIKLAKSIAKKKDCAARFQKDDIKTLCHTKDHFDVIFSNGVMEHFPDREIVAIVNRHLLAAGYVVISIPSDYFTKKQRIFGNERFLSAERWRKILSKTNSVCVEEFSFGDGKHIALAQKRVPFIGFVLRAKNLRN